MSQGEAPVVRQPFAGCQDGMFKFLRVQPFKRIAANIGDFDGQKFSPPGISPANLPGVKRSRDLGPKRPCVISDTPHIQLERVICINARGAAGR